MKWFAADVDNVAFVPDVFEILVIETDRHTSARVSVADPPDTSVVVWQHTRMPGVLETRSAVNAVLT